MNLSNKLLIMPSLIWGYILTVLLFEIYVILNNSESLNILAFFAIILLLFSILIFTYDDKSILSFRNIFIVISFAFHLSHIVLISLGNDTVAGYDMRGYTNDYYYSAAIIFSIRVQVFVFLGMLVGSRATKRDFNQNKKLTKQSENISLRAIFYTGIVLLLIGLFPKLYIDVNKILLFVQGNYLSTMAIHFSGFLVILAGMVNTGIILMVIGKQNNKAFCKNLVIITLFYNILFMITGNRGEGVITILMLLFVYYTIVKKMKITTTLSFIIFGYIFLTFLTFVAETRHITDRNSNILIDTFLTILFKESPLISAFAEFGASIKTVFYSIEFFPSHKEYSYGLNYLNSLLLIFPNIGGLVSEVVNELTFIYYFPSHQVMGGSYIGEMYYAAGNLGIIFAFFVGLLIGTLDKLRLKAISRKKWLNYALCIVVFSSMLWWIRDYFYVMVREIVWVSIVIIFVYKFIEETLKKKSTTKL